MSDDWTPIEIVAWLDQQRAIAKGDARIHASYFLELLEQGVDHDDALEMAMMRSFGPLREPVDLEDE